MPEPQLTTAHRRRVVALLGAWLVLLAALLLEPTGRAPSWLIRTVADAADGLGLPSAMSATGHVGFALNVVAFVPVSLLGSLLWPRPTWRDWTALGFVASFLVEVCQAVFLSSRTATYADVVSNTLGALVGAAVAAAYVRARARSEDRADLPHRPPTTEQDQLPG